LGIAFRGRAAGCGRSPGEQGSFSLTQAVPQERRGQAASEGNFRARVARSPYKDITRRPPALPAYWSSSRRFWCPVSVRTGRIQEILEMVLKEEECRSGCACRQPPRGGERHAWPRGRAHSGDPDHPLHERKMAGTRKVGREHVLDHELLRETAVLFRTPASEAAHHRD